MYNWSVDLSKVDVKSSRFAIWKIEQTVNFGLNNERLSAKQLKRYWKRLVLDPKKRDILSFYYGENDLNTSSTLLLEAKNILKFYFDPLRE